MALLKGQSGIVLVCFPIRNTSIYLPMHYFAITYDPSSDADPIGAYNRFSGNTTATYYSTAIDAISDEDGHFVVGYVIN